MRNTPKVGMFALFTLAAMLILATAAQAGSLAHNIALNATGCSSTGQFSSTYNCDNLYDGSLNPLNTCHIQADSVNQAGAVIELNQSARIANITVFQGGSDYDAGTFNISLSTDNITWVMINTSSFNGVQGGYSSYEYYGNLTFANLSGWPTAKYVRLNSSKDPSSGGPAGTGNCEVRIYEWDGVAPGGGGNPPAQAQLVVNLSDSYDNAAVGNFTATVANSTHSFVNGTTSGVVRFGQVVNLSAYNVSITSNHSGGYFNVSNTTFTIGMATQVNLTSYQAIVRFYGYQYYTGRSFVPGDGASTRTFFPPLNTPLNVSAPLTNNQTVCESTFNAGVGDWSVFCSNATLLLKAGNTTINASGMGINRTFSVNVSALSTVRVNVSFYDALINLTLYNGITNGTLGTYDLNISAVNATGDIGNLSAYQFSTTTAQIFNVPALRGYNFTLIGIRTNTNIPPKNFSLGTSQSYNFSLFGQVVHSIFINIRDEILNAWPFVELDNNTITLNFIGLTVLNVSTNNGSIFVGNLTPGDYEIRYSGSAYDARSSFFTLPAGGSNSVDLYVLNQTLSTLVTVVVVDENDNAINASILKLQRRYIGEGGAFKTVEMGRANFNGQVPLSIVANTQEYRFLVEKNGVPIFLSGETKIVDTALTIQIVTGSDVFEAVKGLENVFTTLSHTQSGGSNSTFTYAFTDTSNFVAGGCLVVKKITLTGEIEICNSCTSSTSATLTCNVNATTGQLLAIGSINGSANYSITTNSLAKAVATGLNTFGNLGPFFTLLIMLAVPFIGVFSIPGSILLAILALGVSVALGFYAISVGAVMGLLATGLLIIYKESRG